MILFDFETKNNIITHVINVNTLIIHVRNVINKLITILKYIKLNKIINFDEKNYYYVDNTNIHLTIDINWKRRTFIALIDFVVTIISFFSKNNFDVLKLNTLLIYVIVSIIIIQFIVLIVLLKIMISNNIIIYETSTKTQYCLQNVAKVFLNIWKNNDDIVNVSKKNWILIKIIFETKSNSSRVYFIDFQNRDFIDKKFNKLYQERKMSWTTKIIFF